MSTSDWPVQVSSVGAVLRSRTRDTNGNEIGTFNGSTRPDYDQVLSLINDAVEGLASAVGSDLPEDYWPRAGMVATYRAAMLVELSYFPEQVATGRSPYEQLRELYREALADLKASLTEAGANVPGDTAGAPSPPSYGFPAPSTLDSVLGPPLGSYAVPYGGGPYQ